MLSVIKSTFQYIPLVLGSDNIDRVSLICYFEIVREQVSICQVGGVSSPFSPGLHFS